MFERFTDSAREVVVGAQEEARSLDHDRIGTEHILLALLRADGTVAARALSSFHVALDAAREQVRAMTTASGSPGAHMQFTPRAKKVLELALREALALHHNYIGSEHILLGIVREGEGAAVQVLANLGVEPADVRARLLELLGGAGGEQPPGEPPGGPRCMHCNGDVSQNLRARSVVLPTDAADEAPGSVTLLWCGTCGAVLTALQPPT